jgi:KUP system potassium uptake protein
MLTWRRGQQISEKARSSLRESEKEFVANLLARPPARLPGTAAFLTSGTVGIPLTLTHHLKHIYALHERVLLVAVRTSEEPRVPEDERAKIQDLPAGITRVTLHYGFMESPSVPEGIRLAHEQGPLRCGDLIETKRSELRHYWDVLGFELDAAQAKAAAMLPKARMTTVL